MQRRDVLKMLATGAVLPVFSFAAGGVLSGGAGADRTGIQTAHTESAPEHHRSGNDGPDYSGNGHAGSESGESE